MIKHGLVWASLLAIVAGSSICRDGYELIPGDVPGQGEFGAVGKFSNIQDTDECGKLCDDQQVGKNLRNHCKSYEYSPTEKRCFLNRKWSPTAGVHKDYSFCALIRKSHF